MEFSTSMSPHLNISFPLVEKTDMGSGLFLKKCGIILAWLYLYDPISK